MIFSGTYSSLCKRIRRWMGLEVIAIIFLHDYAHYSKQRGSVSCDRGRVMGKGEWSMVVDVLVESGRGKNKRSRSIELNCPKNFIMDNIIMLQ
jgi:hypothetical protein